MENRESKAQESAGDLRGVFAVPTTDSAGIRENLSDL